MAGEIERKERHQQAAHRKTPQSPRSYAVSVKSQFSATLSNIIAI
jgi:hypothetical protein